MATISPQWIPSIDTLANLLMEQEGGILIADGVTELVRLQVLGLCKAWFMQRRNCKYIIVSSESVRFVFEAFFFFF
jgi:hypothetical protein